MVSPFLVHKMMQTSVYLLTMYPIQRESAKRVTLDTKYILDIDIKIEKDRDKGYYFNPNKGVRR